MKRPFVYALHLLCIAVHLSQVLSSCNVPAFIVDIVLNSSDFETADNPVYDFESEDSSTTFNLLFSNDCPNDTFFIQQNTGEVKISQPVEFDIEAQKPKCILTSLGYVNSIQTYNCFAVTETLTQSYSVLIIINVIPNLSSTRIRFQEEFYSVEVTEGVEGAVLLSGGGIQAITVPISNLLTPTYRIVTDHAPFELSEYIVKCSKYFQLYTTQPLDREDQNYYELTVEAYTPQTSANTTIRVIVLDRNDNEPEFQSSLISTIISDDSLQKVTRFQATDDDSGVNGRISYSLTSLSSPFTVDPYTGSLYRYSSESVSQNTQTIIRASDSGSPQQQEILTTFTIFIENVHQQPPFIHDPGSLVASEGDLNDHVVTTLHITYTGDLVMYLDSFDCNCFRLSELMDDTGDQYSVDLLVNLSLDYESFPDGVTITLTAADQDNIELSTTEQFTVTISDVNEQPIFPQAEYRVTVLEGTPINSEIFRIQASDPDYDSYGELLYTITNAPQNNPFSLNQTSGIIYSTATVDYETLQSIELVITAEDGGGKTDQTVLKITILDRNDQRPSFTESVYTVEISESIPANESIFHFSASDGDTQCNGGISYSIIFAQPPVFQLDSVSGLFYPLSDDSIDYEMFQQAMVIVRANDLGENDGEFTDATLYIDVTGINDERPEMTKIDCPCFMKEATSATQYCQQLSAYDADSISLTFSIQSGDDPNLFVIDTETGIVSSQGSLLTYEEGLVYSLNIIASDGDFESNPETLNIIVVDKNNDPPHYENSISLVESFDAPIGTMLFDLSVQHGDAGYYALTEYVITSNNDAMDVFRLDSLSGRLYLKSSVQSDSEYTFNVRATDILNPTANIATTEVTVVFSEQYNNPPQFITSVDHIDMASMSTVVDGLYTFNAVDDDSGSNDMLMYSLETSSEIFQVSSDGMLSLSQGLSDQVGSEFTLMVLVTDGGSQPKNDRLELHITVYASTITLSEQQYQYNPGITVRHHFAHILEGTSTSVAVLQLEEDEGGSVVQYTILEQGDFHHAFFIDGFTIMTEEGFQDVFNRNENEQVFVTIQAQYGNNFHYISLTVAINDINNHGPTFGQEEYTIEIYRSTPQGGFIFEFNDIHDPDVGSNAITNFRIEPTSEIFDIVLDTAFLEVIGDIEESVYTLTVIASDSDNTLPSDTATLTITVLETINNEPRILPDIFRVSESRATGDIVGDITVVDDDIGVHGRHTICLASGNLQNHFMIRDSGDKITIQRQLDFENIDSFTLSVMAYDSSPNPVSSITQITINVEDENEKPKFASDRYFATIVENNPPITTVLTVTASDTESDDIVYSIENDTTTFNIDPDMGIISTLLPLNREAMTQHDLTVAATDEEGLVSYTNVLIIVLDQNDNDPSFISPNFVRVKEDTPLGTQIIKLEASDNDIGGNGSVKFEIVSGNEANKFSLDPFTGSLTLRKSLDFETDPQIIEIEFKASDMGIPSLTSEIYNIIFSLENANDNYPIFSSSLYFCTIREGINDFTSSCQVNATDADESDSVSYDIDNGNIGGAFQIHPQTGILSHQLAVSIDREIVSRYILKVKATDSDSPSLTSYTIIVIEVSDENDNVPTFDPVIATHISDASTRLSQLSFSELLPTNTLLFFAHAVDNDIGENSELSYSIITDDDLINLFEVDSNTSAVFLTGNFDFETSQSHSLTIQATNPSGTAIQHTYTIKVMNENENIFPPMFSSDTDPAVSISMTASIGAHLVYVNATDADLGPAGEIRYYITGGSGYGYFTIDQLEGEISVIFTLTGIETSDVTLDILATDLGHPPRSSTYTLVVFLESDCGAKPFFTEAQYTKLAPETFSSEIFASVQALVNDRPTSDIIYSIESGNEHGRFLMNSTTGVISTAGTLNREDESMYTLFVSASRGSSSINTSYAIMAIEVADSNDNTPFFPIDHDVIIFNNRPTGLNNAFMRVFAIDYDIGENSELEYSITSDASGNFAIDSTTGDMYLIQSLPETDETLSYTITVRVTDMAILPLSESTTFTVTVIPPADLINNPAPFFSPSSTVQEISEDTFPGTLVYSAQASDGSNDNLLYRIINPLPNFVITPNSGEIYLIKSLDREDEMQYTIQIDASDGSLASSTFLLNIVVTNVNDNRPYFTTREIVFMIAENETMIGQLNAEDDDDDVDISDVTYSLVDSKEPSSMDIFSLSEDGVLQVIGTIDREVQPVHFLTVAAVDNGIPSLTSYTRVKVIITDVNDHTQVFISPLQNISISEATAVGTPFFVVSLFDPDSTAVFDYTLLPETAPFAINDSTAELYVLTELDAEEQTTYSLTITVSDRDFPSRTATTTLEVTVIDELDSPPVLTDPGTITIPENMPVYSIVTTVANSENLRPVYYDVISGNEENHFFIESLTGIIRTAVGLDRESTPSYRLTVQGEFQHNYETNVSFDVLVGDVNDNAPMFSQHFLKYTLQENSSVSDAALVRLDFIDYDQGINRQISDFYISDPRAASIFNVDSLGNLRIHDSLDREGKFDAIDFKVYLFDSGSPPLYDVAHISITVSDINDNPPHFLQSSYSFTVSLPVLVDTVLFYVEAVDIDIESIIRYRITDSNGTDKFSINAITGGIAITDNYKLQPYYSLFVSARDDGDLEESVAVSITTKQCGFNNLLFFPREVSMKFAENITNGTLIFSPNILTFDTTVNLIYSLSTAESQFVINNSTGEVTLGSSLDREQQSYHHLSVQARDIDDIDRIAQADIEIIVTDVNDNAPTFERESYELYVTSNYTGNIIRLRASDNDEGSNGEVRYFLESGCSGAFDIEENTGQLSLLASLDMFIDGSCSMSIRASDNGNPQMSDFTTVTVNLVNSNAPLFSSNGVYSAEVNESAPRDTVVITVTAEATSPDPHIRYNINSSQATTFLPFSIDFVSGNVTVNGIGLDYETNTSYILHLEAIDLSTSLVGRATLDIQVLDVNDNRPEFSMAFYQDSVTENSNDGISVVQVSAIDLDSGTNADITYFIDPNDIATTFFTIDDETGLISTSAMIDREQNNLFRFSVLAKDGSNPSLTGTTIVQIEVLDVNDNAPSFFEALYHSTIFEDDPQGTSVIFVTATDLDEDSLEYDIVPTPGSSNFDISSGGLVTLTTAASTLSDYQYQLNVSAFDGTFYGYTQVLIDLNNENNNPPMFNATTYNAYIIENAMIGAVVIQVFATDDDRGINAELIYSVSSDLFDIDSNTGVITVESELDREMNPDGVTLIVIARDGGGRTGTAQVDIELGDVNDNPPTFSSLVYAFDVLETVDIGTTVSTTVTATDPDNGVNGTVHYSIHTNDPEPDQFPFDINEQSGVITTILNLDTDVQAEYIFTVSAVDMGTPEMSAEIAMVTVQVIVDGEVPPMFENPTYDIDIFENNPSGVELFTPQLILTNSTVECDIIIFSLIPDGNLFDIDEDSATITVTQQLDREEMSLHTFTIQADCLPLHLSNLISQFALVTVNVLDVNEEPSFGSVFFIRASIVENIAIDSILELGVVLAMDEDFGTNGDISYSIDSDEDIPFVVHPGTGFISVSGDLDREMRDEYRFNVIASDHGTPPLSDDIRIIVTIEDTNDSPPVFDDEIYHGQVSEDASVDTSIITVTASDADTEEFAVNFYSVSGSNVFSIHNTTGNLIVAGALDRESRSTYTLQITASDGINEATTTIMINVTDINDNVPVFNDTQYGIEVYENSEIGIGFLQVFATDQDIGENAEIRYGILEDQNLVQINDSTGVVSFSETPDYEMSQQGHFEFRVTATNPNNENMVGLSTLVIDLIDLNDNAPQFTRGNGPFPVLENQPSGVLVVRTVAEDLDSGINSRVEYTLSEESQQYFTIELQTGTIHSSVTFDREMNSTYEIFVTAIDLGDPPLSSNTTLLVVISDENDNPPLFARDNYTIHVFEGVSVGEVIENIRADDADEGINAELMYRLTGDNSAHFSLAMQNDGSFDVQVAQMLNHENIAEYDLTITAFDGGFPFLESEVSLKIIVRDENDNPPEFDQPFYPKMFCEDLELGSEIVRVHARDPDSAETTQLTYSIVEPERHTQFEIDTISGTILLVEPLDFETDESHIIIVQADDQLNTPATASVVVTVLNINDNAPLFTMPTYTTSITENEPAKTLFDFTVFDNDKGSDPDIISFEIGSGNINGIFHLDSRTGSLTVSQFDYEVYGISEYLLTITANDNAQPPLTGTAMVTVIAHDINDNAPETENQVIHVLLYNGQLALTTLGKLLIRDPDTVNDHVFDILSGDGSVFSIGLSGEIDVIQQPPPLGVYNFTIQVTDGILGSATTYVNIKVANITDAHLANSFTMQVDVDTAELFLNDHLQQFLTAIETLFVDKTSFVSPRAYVWNITNNHESTIDISVVVESMDGNLIHPNLVQHLMHINREDFKVAMTATISRFSVVTEDVDQCGTESICPLDMFCTVSYDYSSSSVVIGSAAASLVGIDSGEYITCSNETSLCSVPCSEPSYCIQQNGQSVCVDDCTPNPCKNDGKCQDQVPGYYCSCPSGFDGRNCELTTAYFQKGSYVILPAVSTSTNGTISIEFLAAAGEEGLLYYSSRFNDDQRDFIALEVSAGQVSLFISYGGDPRRLQARHNAGRWQTAIVEYTTSVSSKTDLILHSSVNSILIVVFAAYQSHCEDI